MMAAQTERDMKEAVVGRVHVIGEYAMRVKLQVTDQGRIFVLNSRTVLLSTHSLSPVTPIRPEHFRHQIQWLSRFDPRSY
jgi:hypothetical protein